MVFDFPFREICTFIFNIFFHFRSIQCSRLSVHKNLVIAFILYFISNIVMYEPMIFKHKLNNELNGTSEDDIVWTTAGLYDGKKVNLRSYF